MPYDSNEDLPEDVRQNMPAEAQDVFREVFNSAEEQYDEEGRAFATAYAALKRAGWEQNDAGEWIEKAEGERKSTPADPDEQREGSDQNEEDSASDASNDIELSDKTVKALKNKVADHNEKHGDDPGKEASLGQLKAVYRRGAGAFSDSHRPSVDNRNQWAMGRVNAFLYLLRNGKPEDSEYVTDNDLLPKEHPRSTKTEKVVKQELTEEERTPPKKAQENAKKVLEWKDKHGDEVDAMTQTGWRRANQLADGKPLSIDVISRMSQFKRHQDNADIDEEYKGEPWKDNGHVAWLGWGGDAGVNWANEVMDKVEKKEKVIKQDEHRRYTLGVVYEPYEVDAHDDWTDEREIEKAAWKFMKKLQTKDEITKTALNMLDSVVKALKEGDEVRLDVTDILNEIEKNNGLNDMHDNTINQEVGTVVECYTAPTDFEIDGEEVKKGSWLLGVQWTEEYFEKILNGQRTGYSMEGSGKRKQVSLDRGD